MAVFRFIFITIYILVSSAAHGQDRHHHNVFWGRVVVADTINSKFKWEVWLQMRTQNTTEHHLNIFKAPQFSTVWTWLNYNITKDLKVGVTPFSYFNTWPLYVKPSDLEVEPIKEFRWVVRLEHQKKLKSFNLINRGALEYRLRDFLNTGTYISNYRARYMLRLDKTFKTGFLKKPLTVTLYDEIMFQFGKAVQYNASTFDQNRIYAGFNYEIYKNVKLNLSYLYTIQLRPNGRETDYINTLWVILTFDNAFSQFYSKQRH